MGNLNLLQKEFEDTKEADGKYHGQQKMKRKTNIEHTEN